MTLSAGTNPDDNADKKSNDGSGDQASGQALEPAADSDAGMTPVFAAADERFDAKAGRPIFSRVLDIGAPAAMIVGLLGCAWTIGDHFTKQAVAPVKIVAAPTAPVVDETAQLSHETQKLAADVTALRQSLEAMRTAIRQDKTNDQIRSLGAAIDSVKNGLATNKAESAAALASLATKIDHLPHAEAMAKIQQVVDRLDKMERQNADPAPTASIAPPPKATPIAMPPVKPQAAKTPAAPAETVEAAKKPVIIAEWVTREVYNGVALVESKHGPIEVAPGDQIPGAGTVKSIERHGGAWVVTTTKGQIAYAPPPRDRPVRDYYRAEPIPREF